MMGELYRALAALYASQASNLHCPGPVQEDETIVRLPAFSDGQKLNQGGTFIRRNAGTVLVQLDGGRWSSFGSVNSAWNWFQEECVVWRGR